MTLFLPEHRDTPTEQRTRSYKIANRTYARVSTALGIINKPAIGPWMVKVAGEKMREHLLNEDVRNEIARAAESPEVYEEFVTRLFESVKAAPNAERDERGERGHGIHEKVAAWLALPENKRGLLHGPAAGAADFIQEWDISVIAGELVIWDDELEVAGTLDGVGTLPDGSLVVWDWKTGSGPWWEMALQLGAYGHMYGGLAGRSVDRLFVVKLTEEDYYVHEVEDTAAAWEGYLQALALHRSSKVPRFVERDIFDTEDGDAP